MKEVKQDKPSASYLDRAIRAVAPGWGLKRERARAKFDILATYRSGTQGRLDRSWPSTGQTVSSRTEARNLADVRARARDLEENNAVANGLLSRLTDNVIASGMNFQARTADEGWNRECEALFTDWDDKADVRRLASFGELQRLMFRSSQCQGDMGCILLGDGSLQVIEADSIATPPEKQSDTSVVDGVQLDRRGRPVRFYVADYDDNAVPTYTPVAARDFVFFTRRERANQTRGVSVFAQTAARFDQLDGYFEAVLTAAQVAAMHCAVVTGGDENLLGAGATTTDSKGNVRKDVPMEPGMFKFMPESGSVTQMTPQQPSTGFDVAVETFQREMGLPVGLPLEILALNFSRTSYSSMRGALLQAYRSFRAQQRAFKVVVLRRIARWRISKWIKAGELTARDDAWSHEWIPDGWEWVDPQKEAVAHFLAKDMSAESGAEIVASRGGDWETVMRQCAREENLRRELGLPEVHSHLSRTPTAQQKQEQQRGESTAQTQG